MIFELPFQDIDNLLFGFITIFKKIVKYDKGKNEKRGELH